MELKECLEMIYVACTHYDFVITGKLGTEREYEGSYEQAHDIVSEELDNRIPKERINEQIRFLNDEGYFEFNTKRDLEKATKILNNLLNKE